MPEVLYYEATPGGRDVIDKFLSKELKNRYDATGQLLDHLRILEETRFATLREEGRLEHVNDEIFSYRFKVMGAGNLWIRLLLAFWPTDATATILLPLLKKGNKLDPVDIAQSKKNLSILKNRTEKGKKGK